MYRPRAKLTILFLTALTLFGCSGTRAYRTQQVLIEKNEVYQESQLLKNDPVNFIITTPTNKKFLGIPIKKMLYESAHPEPQKSLKNGWQKKRNGKNAWKSGFRPNSLSLLKIIQLSLMSGLKTTVSHQLF